VSPHVAARGAGTRGAILFHSDDAPPAVKKMLILEYSYTVAEIVVPG
jgi:hypothetical protein